MEVDAPEAARVATGVRCRNERWWLGRGLRRRGTGGGDAAAAPHRAVVVPGGSQGLQVLDLTPWPPLSAITVSASGHHTIAVDAWAACQQSRKLGLAIFRNDIGEVLAKRLPR